VNDLPDERRSPRSPVAGNLRLALLWLALPVMAEQFLVYLVEFYDTYLAGQLPRAAEVVSAIGIAGYVGWLASLLFGLVGAGTTALVARHWGANEPDDANRVTNRSIALAIVMGLLVAATIAAVAPLLAGVLVEQESGRALATRYLRLYSIGYVFTGVTLIGAAALRGAGDTRTPMILLGLVSLLNVVVSRTLVYGVGPFAPLGGVGIVWGTVVARAAGCGLMLIVLGRGTSLLRITFSELRLRGRTVRRILRIGGPAVVDGGLMWIGHFVFLLIVARIDPGDPSILAAHMIGVRLEAITYLPAVAWGAAAATIVGQSLGARRVERARRVGHEANLQCGFLALGAALAFGLAARPILAAMTRDPRIVEVGVPALHLLAWFQLPLVLSIVYVQALRGAGDTRYSMIATAIGVYGVRIPVAYLCAIVLQMGLVGAWIGMCSDVALRAVLMYLRYTFGRWENVAE
jgi:multidrug resistance protein, MATE family